MIRVLAMKKGLGALKSSASSLGAATKDKFRKANAAAADAAYAIAQSEDKAATSFAKIQELTAKNRANNIQEKLVDATASSLATKDSLNSSKLWGQRIDNVRNTVDTITKPFRKIGDFFFNKKYPIAHYITLIIVILILIGGFSVWFAKGSTTSNKRMWTQPSTFRTFLQKFLPGYKMNLIARNLSPYSGNPPTTDRPIIQGRCDEINWKESKGVGGGLCTRTTVPQKTIWTMNVDKQPELSQLPQSVKDIITNKGAKYIVYIPWKNTGMSYVPDIDNATFSDGSPAKNLFIDNGLTIKKKEGTRNVYYAQYRPYTDTLKFKDLATFASENNPMCN